MKRLIVAVLLAVSACIPPEEKLRRAESEKASAALDVAEYKQALEKATDTERRRALTESLVIARRRLDIAQRDLDQLMAR